MSTEIFMVVGQDALPSNIELCKRMVSLNIKTVFIILSALSSQLPVSFRENAMIDVVEIPVQEVGADSDRVGTIKQFLESYLTTPRSIDRGPVGAIFDMGSFSTMGWLIEMFSKNHIPTCGFINSSAFSAEMEYVTSLQQQEMKSGWLSLCFPGCGLVESGEKVISTGGAGDHPPRMGFIMKPFMGVMINTFEDLEHPFVEEFGKKLKQKLKQRVWSVGPLFPRQYFRLYATAVRPSNEGEAIPINWLDSQLRGSVLLVSFGTSVDLNKEEYLRLADALGTSPQPFIWVVPPESDGGGDFPNRGVHGKGMITSEVIPQFKILNHPSVAGFLSHCNWDSMMESLGLGVPVLAWPKTVEQLYNAKLVVKKLKVGRYVCDNFSLMVNGEEAVKSISKGIDKLIGDKHMKRRAADLGAKFSLELYESSKDALVRFTDDLALL